MTSAILWLYGDGVGVLTPAAGADHHRKLRASAVGTAVGTAVAGAITGGSPPCVPEGVQKRMTWAPARLTHRELTHREEGEHHGPPESGRA